jgi:hypothetical protein
MKNHIQYRDIMKAYSKVGRVGGPGYAVRGGLRGFAGQGYAMTAAEDDAAAAAYAADCGAACAPCDLPVNTVSRIIVAGFKPKCIGGCQSETVHAEIDAQGQLLQLYIDPGIASQLTITDLRIGRWPAFGNCEPIPASYFSCCDALDQFTSNVFPANTRICMTVKNKRKQPVEFEALLKLAICEPC